SQQGADARPADGPAGQRPNHGHAIEPVADTHRERAQGNGAVRFPARVAVATPLLAVSSHAAYHYVHYPSRNNFTPIFEKFNLAALPNNTVTFFVADQGANTYGPNETFGSVLSQLKEAAAAWNSVGTSDLRVAFGGLEAYSDNPTVARPGNPVTNSATPGGDVI